MPKDLTPEEQTIFQRGYDTALEDVQAAARIVSRNQPQSPTTPN